jgi:hypothetical protein
MNRIQKLYLVIACFLLSTSNSFSGTNSIKPAEPNNENQKRLHEYIERARNKVKNPRTTFSCQGIGVQDNGSALDGDIYYFRESTHELISMSGMAFCISAATEAYADSKLFCPPPELRTDFCIAKYKEQRYKECLSHKTWYEKTFNKVIPPCTKQQ